MKIASQIVLSASLLFLLSCSENKNNATKQTQAAPVPAANTNGAQPAAGAPAGNVALNPAHGQPGHRCDIEVGAPLNLPAQPNLSAPAKVAPVVTGQAEVKPGTNPPHGYPGHDCGVAVGAPLTK